MSSLEFQSKIVAVRFTSAVRKDVRGSIVAAIGDIVYSDDIGIMMQVSKWGYMGGRTRGIESTPCFIPWTSVLKVAPFGDEEDEEG